jgi:hypothetical protein
MPVQTVQWLTRRARRLNQLNDKVDRVITAMRGGAVLRRHHQPSSTLWCLSTGQPVTTEIARLVIEHSEIVAVGDCLFGPELSQTFRYID